ncbi:c-type cytochrome [Massilia endophytica]|uniref:c-type cytochrome n=1 Tax=Massilia endophytica TaxID=2899220 RepID=UPI001E489221|nr:c-type cytochrome [Massilia endophytica]UGQ48766.1 c-type cytochrome [Massilia endophytica]
MSRFTKLLFALAFVAGAAQAQTLVNVGRPATAREIAAWDIDVRPDFKGLPKGSGTVSAGMAVWEGKCASCHGTFGESNEVFTPIIGGTTAEDIKTGRVAALANNRQPQRTTMMKVATVSTLWDYVNRAMPWTAPKSLSTDEVYSVVAYILNMAEVVPDDFTLSDKNIAEVQKRMPNRNGMTNAHGMWDVKGKPDVKSVACMKDCPPTDLRSTLPDVSRNAHGNVAEQNRGFGAVRGVDTTKPAATAPLAGRGVAAAAPVARPAAAPAAAPAKNNALALAQQNACLGCHGLKDKVVGPGFAQIAAKYKGDAKAGAALAAKIKAGGSGVWGPVPMPPQAQLKDADLQALAGWILNGAK